MTVCPNCGHTITNRELTPRELEIFRLLASGQVVKEIACTLNLSVKTIEVHKYNLMQKLNIHKIGDLIKRAIEQGVIQVEIAGGQE